VSRKRYTFFVSDLRVFVGDEAAASAAALLDDDQFPIDSILAYKGDPEVRTTMDFLVLFQDGSKLWLPYSEDLHSTAQYEAFCTSIPHLRVLRYPTSQVGRVNAAINKSPITEVVVGDRVYVDLRSYGHIWFDSLDLPEALQKCYVVEYVYTKISNSRRTIWASCAVFQEMWRLNHVFVMDYGAVKIFDPRLMVLIDDAFLRSQPSVRHPLASLS
jgi:hypothetical protein